jgi:hypothetical protein
VRFYSFLEESQEVLTVTGRFALTEDFTGAHVQRSKQVRRAVADVVMSAFFGRVELDRQHRLGPVQRLDLRFLVHREHYGPTWGNAA